LIPKWGSGPLFSEVNCPCEFGGGGKRDVENSDKGMAGISNVGSGRAWVEEERVV